MLWAIETFGSDELIIGMSIRVDGEWVVTLPAYVALLVGLLTVVGPRAPAQDGQVVVEPALDRDRRPAHHRRRVAARAWSSSFLIGRVTGLGIRYLSGVQSERAYGASLVAGVRRAGFEPVRLLRVADETTEDGAGPQPRSRSTATPRPAR